MVITADSTFGDTIVYYYTYVGHDTSHCGWNNNPEGFPPFPEYQVQNEVPDTVTNDSINVAKIISPNSLILIVCIYRSICLNYYALIMRSQMATAQ